MPVTVVDQVQVGPGPLVLAGEVPALRELKNTRYTLLRADSVLRHLWLQAPATAIAPLRDAAVRERFRRSLQRRINLWGLSTALLHGRRWRSVTLTLRLRPGPVTRIEVSAVESTAPRIGSGGRGGPR